MGVHYSPSYLHSVCFLHKIIQNWTFANSDLGRGPVRHSLSLLESTFTNVEIALESLDPTT
jgi:hypothetical protein